MLSCKLIILYLIILDIYQPIGISEMEIRCIIDIIFIVSTILLPPNNAKVLAKKPGNDGSEYPKYVIVDKGDNKKSLIELTGVSKTEGHHHKKPGKICSKSI